MVDDFDRINSFVMSLSGKLCWHVGAGGLAASTFSLSFGGQRAMQPPLRSPTKLRSTRAFNGEFELMVWCTWRLDDTTIPLASSDQDAATVKRGLDCLCGKAVTGIDVRPPAWDLTILFSDDVRLSIFPDHLPPVPSFSGNWELAIAEEVLIIGVGSSVIFEPRTGI